MVVAPCFDKKLEAVREEFYNSLLESRDVDCVLTSGLTLILSICLPDPIDSLCLSRCPIALRLNLYSEKTPWWLEGKDTVHIRSAVHPFFSSSL